MASDSALGAGTDRNANMSSGGEASLLIVIGEPYTADHKDLVLERITQGLKSWDRETSGCDINSELETLAAAAQPAEDGLPGERLIRHGSETLNVQVLVNPQAQTVTNHLRRFLLSGARYRHLVYAGHAMQGSGDWLLQNDVFAYANLSALGKDTDIENNLKQQDLSTLVISTFNEGDWNDEKIAKQNIGKIMKVKVNPPDQLEDMNGVLQFSAYLSYFIKVRTVKDLLQASDVVGNIRFSRPTLYIFPGSQGDSALFGISGFNLLINGGYSRKACFWDFTRHLDRIDAVLLTHLGVDNLFGIGSVLERKAQEPVHPEIGYLYMNAVEKVKHSPNGDSQPENGGSHKPPSLLVNLVEEGNRLVENLRHLGQTPHPCIGHMSGQNLPPINLYHKVGHGSLDMYVLNPQQDSKELKDFFSQWNKHVNNFTNVKNKVGDKELSVPLPSMVSVCALLVWRPSSPVENITRILFPGNVSQNKLFEGLDKLKNQDIFQHENCSEKGLNQPKTGAKKGASGRAGARGSIPKSTPPPSSDSKKPVAERKAPKSATPPKPEKISKEEKNVKKAASKKSPASSTASTKTPTPVTSPADASPKVITPEPPVQALKESKDFAEPPAAPVEKPAEPEPVKEPEAEPVLEPEPEPVEEPEQAPVQDSEPESVNASPQVADLLGDFAAPEGQDDLIKPEEAKEEALMPEADQSIPSDQEDTPAALPEPVQDPEEPVKVEDVLIEQAKSEAEPVVEEDLLGSVSAAPVEAAPAALEEPILPAEPCLAPEPVLIEKPEEALEHAVQEPSNNEQNQQLEELGIYDDIEEKDIDTAADISELDQRPEADGGIPAVMTTSMYDDMAAFEDPPMSTMTKSAEKRELEEMGIYDDPESEQGSAGIPEDIQGAASQEPEADQMVFGGAAPEGLPDPSEPAPGSPFGEDPDILSHEDNILAKEPILLEESKVTEKVEDTPVTEPTVQPDDVAPVESAPELEPQVDQEPEVPPEKEPEPAVEDFISSAEAAQVEKVEDTPVSEPAVQPDDVTPVESAPEPEPEVAQEPEVPPEKEPESAVEDLIGSAEAAQVETKPAEQDEPVLPAEPCLAPEPVVVEKAEEVPEEYPEKVQETALEAPETCSEPEDTILPAAEEPETEPSQEVVTEKEEAEELEKAFAPIPSQLDQQDVDSLDQDDDLFARDITPDPTEKTVSPESVTESEQALAVDPEGYPESVDSVEKIPADQAQRSSGEEEEEDLSIGEPQCGAEQLHSMQGPEDASLNPFGLVDGPQGGIDTQMLATNPFLGMDKDQEGDIPQTNGLMQPSAEMPEPKPLLQQELRESVDRDSLEREDANEFDPLKSWGEPMGLPAPPPPSVEAAADKKPSSARSKNGPPKKAPTPKKADSSKTSAATKTAPKKSPMKTLTKTTSTTKSASATTKKEPKKDLVNGKEDDKVKNGVGAKSTMKTAATKKPASAGTKKAPARPTTPQGAKKAETKTPTRSAATKRTGAPAKSAPASAKSAPLPPVVPFYVDLTYVPHHGDAYYTDLGFFRRVRARYYIISSLNPSPATLNALLDAKQTWDKPDAEVTIIPTYDTDTLRLWMNSHRDSLDTLKVDVAPSASRCTIQLQDHETSCAAYRLEF